MRDKITQNNDLFIQKELRPFLQIASPTLNSKGITKAKNYILSYLADIAEDIKTVQGEINPVILAKIKGNSPIHLLVYMMYDTQPVNELKEWIAPPFDAELKSMDHPLKHLGKCIIARGAYNSKTPLIAFLNVIKLLKQENQLPLSLLLVFDGEEERGSPTLLNLLKERKELFQECLDAYYPAIKQDLDGNAVLKLGYKGILSLQINIKSPNLESHSSYSSVIPNPAYALIDILKRIYSHNKYKINSLSEDYEISGVEQELVEELLLKNILSKIKEKAGIEQISIKDPNKFLKSYFFNPTFNISTLKAGYVKEGIKNSVPNFAIAKIDIRFAQQISHNLIFKEIEEKVKASACDSNLLIKITKKMGYESSRVSKNSAVVKSLLEAFKQLHINAEIWPLSAAASPLSKIQERLGINYITGGLGIGGNAHAANEFVQLTSIINTRLGYYYFLNHYNELKWNSIKKSI